MRNLLVYLLSSFLLFVPFSCEELEKAGLSETEIISGLKEALNIGAGQAGSNLSQVNGYFGNQALKILLPPEAQPVLNAASTLGLQPQIDDLVLKLNRGAEKAAGKAAPIFANAITTMTVSDAMGILKGSDTAATGYLRAKTFAQLTNAFAPEINSAMDEVGATAVWNTVFSTYNTYANTLVGQLAGLKPVETDLGKYATGKALNGLFTKVAEEEKLIRENPARRTTEILRKVFAEQD
jgi:hypothetical protein